MKRQALLGQWNTPPQMLYPSSGSGLKKSASVPALNSTSVEKSESGQGGGGGQAGYSRDFVMGGVSLPLQEPSAFDGDHSMGSSNLYAQPPYPLGGGGNLEDTSLRFSSSSQGYGYLHECSLGMPKRAMSHQQLHQQWGNDSYSRNGQQHSLPEASPNIRGSQVRHDMLKHESVGFPAPGVKRSALVLEGKMPPAPQRPTSASQQFANPGNIMLQDGSGSSLGDNRKNNAYDPSVLFGGLALGAGPSGNGKSMAKQDAAGASTSAARKPRPEDEAIEEEDRRKKRLARNRASARMRRLKKKTMTDSLQLEVEELQCNIAFLASLESYRRQEGIGDVGILSYPREALEAAYVASQTLERGGGDTANDDDDEMHGSSAASASKADAGSSGGVKDKDKEEEARTLTHEEVSEQLAQLDLCDLEEILKGHLVAGETQGRSTHPFRREVALQLFLDSQFSWAENLRSTGMANGALRVMMAADPTTDAQQQGGPSQQALQALRVTRALASKICREGSTANLTTGIGAKGAKSGSSARKITNAKVSTVRPNSDAVADIRSMNIIDDGLAKHEQVSPRSARKGPLGIDPFPLGSMYKGNSPNQGVGGVDNTSSKDGTETDCSPDPAKLAKKIQFLRQDLFATIDLSPAQCEQIRQLAFGQQKEQLCVQAFMRMAGSLSANRWMDYPGVEQIQDGFRSLLLSSQMDRFCTWSQRNLSAIDSLDISLPRPPHKQPLQGQQQQVEH